MQWEWELVWAVQTPHRAAAATGSPHLPLTRARVRVTVREATAGPAGFLRGKKAASSLPKNLFYGMKEALRAVQVASRKVIPQLRGEIPWNWSLVSVSLSGNKVNKT